MIRECFDVFRKEKGEGRKTLMRKVPPQNNVLMKALR